MLFVILAVVTGFFGVGLFAGWADVYALLFVYPFRLGDVLLPLFFWVLGLEFLVRVFRSLSRSKGLVSVPSLVTVLPLILFLAGAGEMGRDIGMVLGRGGGMVTRSWAASLSGEVDPFDAMAEWIDNNAESDAILAADPCRGDLTLKAGRRMVVSLKAGPALPSAYGWYERLQALNGGVPFRSAGSFICGELEENFSALDRVALRRIRDLYGAGYYLTNTDRPDLAIEPVHRSGPYRLYDLRGLGG
jgi:hypothetical protein